MPNELPVVYWDACCFIGRIQREPDKIADVEAITKHAQNSKLLILTSTITIGEVLSEPDPSLSSVNGFNTINEFFDHSWIQLRTPDRRTMEITADLRRNSPRKLKLADAIHLATAIRWKIRVLEFHTYDKNHLLSLDGLIGDPPLKIVKPRYPEEHPLFDQSRDPEKSPDSQSES